MLKNYLKIAWRNLLRGKGYSFINVSGLAFGLTCVMLIGLWITQQLSINRFFPDADRLYAVYTNSLFNGETVTSTNTPSPLEQAIAADIPQVEAVTKVGYAPDLLFTVKEKSMKEAGKYVSSGFFAVFGFHALTGNPRQAITQVDQIVITKRIALKYFNSIDVVGKTILIDQNKSYTVGAVLDDIASNSTLQFDWLLNSQINEQDWMKRWGNNAFDTYLKLKPRATAAQASAALKDIYPRYAPDLKSTPVLQSIQDVYLYNHYRNGKPDGGRIAYVRLFALIALFILLIACINFMNLATARSLKRAKEVGVLKTIGASRKTLIIQFYVESFLTTLLAFVLAFCLLTASLRLFNRTFHTELFLPLKSTSFWFATIGVMLFTALIAGSYPALFLSAFRPIYVLKGVFKSTKQRWTISNLTIRKGLVIFQFTIAIFLTVAIFAFGRQINYIQHKNLGMARENVLYIPLDGAIYQHSPAFRQEITQLPSVVAASAVAMLPMDLQSASGDLSWEDKDPTLETSVKVGMTGYDFAETMAIPIVAGRDFAPEHPADTTGYLINEAAAHYMGLKDPVGKEITFWNGKQPIIGILKDFHTESLHAPITPLILCFSSTENSGYMLVRVKAGRVKEAINGMADVAKRMNPNYPFTYHFVDETYEEMYRNEALTTRLVQVFGSLATLISCMGLFGLVSFSAEQRTKEISIRKVIGASFPQIIGLLSKDFVRLILTALLVAFPLAFWAINTWLNSFAYRIDLGWSIFALAGACSLSIALITISFQAIRAARANPVDSLRNE